MITHSVWDTGCYSSLDRLARKHHALESQRSLAPDAQLQALLDFVVSRPDCLHDAAIAFAWAMRPLTSTTLMKDLCVGLAALRNGYNILMENLMAWLLGALAFVADSELEPAQTME